MGAFLARRLLLAIAALLAFSFVSFLLFASQFYPLRGHPILPAYWRWLRGVPSGRNLVHGLSGPIWPALGPSLGHTLVLLALTFVLVVVFAVLLATAAAVRRGSALDVGLRTVSYLAWGVPAFLLGLIVQTAANGLGGPHGFGPFPIAGWPGSCPAGLGIDAGTITPCPAAGTGLRYVANIARYVTLPALTLSVGFVAVHSRYLRSSLAAALDAPYAMTARAKGLPEATVVFRHALRNSLITFVSAVLSDFGAIFSAALAVDWVFQLNGVGSLFFREINPNAPVLDAYAAETLLLVSGLLLLATSLLSELAVIWLDPRARPS